MITKNVTRRRKIEKKDRPEVRKPRFETVESFSGKVEHARAHSGELGTARIMARGTRGQEQRLDEISGIIKST